MIDDFFERERIKRLRRLGRTEETKDKCKREVHKNDLEQNVAVHLANKKNPWKMPKLRPIGIPSELYNTLKNIAYRKKLKLSQVWKLSCDILSAVFGMIVIEQRPKNADWMAVQWENHHRRLIKNKKREIPKIIKVQKEFNMDDDFDNLKEEVA